LNNTLLKITLKDWIIIVAIGSLLGFLLGWLFYFFNPLLQSYTTILFATLCAFSISLFALLLISFSNHKILPNINARFWYGVSLGFSFFAGMGGFVTNFTLFSFFQTPIIELLQPHWYFIAFICGVLTLGIGLLFHWFIVLKNRHEETQHALLESKLKALENELNPHFLFNALNSMSELVYSDAKKAEEAILNLSKLLRNAIKNESLVALSKELAMVKTYVDIENIRFEEKINLHINTFDCNDTVLIPKFSIQLLVENAIKHGFTSDVLNITIDITQESIVVQNDGKIEEKLIYGTGLKNLQQRLQMLNIGTLHCLTHPCMCFKIQRYGKIK
jgi:two-component system, LytTR family, sensor kinase